MDIANLRYQDEIEVPKQLIGISKGMDYLVNKNTTNTANIEINQNRMYMDIKNEKNDNIKVNQN